MKLSDIIRCRYNLRALINKSQFSTEFNNFADAAMTALRRSSMRDEWETLASQELNNIHNSYQNLNAFFERFFTVIDQIVDQGFELYNSESEYLYNNIFVHDMRKPQMEPDEPFVLDWPVRILTRRLLLDDENLEVIQNRIKYHTSWEYPGLLIRPGEEQYILSMVPLDPLYLADQSLTLLQQARKHFPEIYQRRLRTYEIKDEDDTIFANFPQGQFAFVMAWYFFDFKPLRIVKKYLDQMFDLLRPGGVVAFTFNDCDYPYNVEQCEANFACYTPGSLVKQYAQSVGYKILSEYHTAGQLHWIELQRPGELSTMRGGQSLAQIIPIHL